MASGKLSPEQAAKIFDDLNVPADQWVMPTDLCTEEQRLIDEHCPVERAQDFLIVYADPGGPAPPMTKDFAQFDQSARAWLVRAEFPREFGNSLIANIESVVQVTKHMDANQLEQYGVDEFAKLEAGARRQARRRATSTNRKHGGRDRTENSRLKKSVASCRR